MINNQSLLPSICIEPTKTAQFSVIWLHGLGADGNDFASIVPQLRIPEYMPIRFIFPHAPAMPVTINQGYKMPAWFDIYDIDLSSRADKEGVKRSTAEIHKLIDHEVQRGIPSDHIILAGFSQGSVIAFYSGLTYPSPLAGIVALSGLLPHAEELIASASPANQQIPIFIAHGTMDNIVPIKLGELSYQALVAAGYEVSWHTYPMAHSVCMEEISDISGFIQKMFNIFK